MSTRHINTIYECTTCGDRIVEIKRTGNPQSTYQCINTCNKTMIHLEEAEHKGMIRRLGHERKDT